MAVRIEAGSEPIPGYKLIDRIGGGGFGEVWKAEAPGGLLKAIKVVYGDLTTTEADGTRRAEQELKALKRVQSVRHPYLLSLERYDIIEGRLLIVMELADRNLWDRFREARTQNLQGIPRDELMRYMEETAEVLDLMNAQHQLQHLDIKPQNLFLVHNHAKVADFGLVKDLEGKLATVTGGITPVYAAPETFDGVVSRFCDQYSLAIVYQELLTGQRPFSGNSIQQLIMQHLSATPNLTPLPKEDRPAIGRGLAKDPEKRFPTCMDMVKALRNAGAVEAPVPAGRGANADNRQPGTPPQTIVGARGPGVRSHREVPPRRPTPVDVTPSRGETTTLPPEPVEVILDVEELRPVRSATPEIKGEGPLRPALVIGLGQKGLEVLQGLRDDLRDRFSNAVQLSHLRTLYIETDQDAAQAVTSPAKSAQAIPPADVLLARLNRVGHYFRQGSGRSTHESWLSPKILNRIPARNPVTTGLRALGRLAFLDNFKSIVGRLREELDAITNPEALSQAVEATGLALRTNRPRVYIVTGLAGGTGSGMFIDVAYAVRYLLMQIGYTDPDVIGVLLLPMTPQAANRTGVIGNAVAALTELNHFSQPGHPFLFRADDRDDQLRDESPPFRQTILFPLEPEGQPGRAGETSRLVGDYLYRDLVTLLGRVTDERRLALRPHRGSEVTCRAVGLYRFSWPRRMLLRRAGRVLCYQLIQAWTDREPASLESPVKSRLGEELQRMDLDAEHMAIRLQEVLEQELKRKPESFFQEILAPLARSRRALDIDVLFDALSQLEELVGTPNELAKPEARRSGALAEYLDHAAVQVAEEWAPPLVNLAMSMIDIPELRFAGAEEALDQLATVIDTTIEHHETLASQWGEEAAGDYDRIINLLRVVKDSPGSRKATAATTELLELFDRYARGCYRCLQLRQVCALYAHLRGQLAESLPQIDFCRQRLAEVSRAFEELGPISVGDAPVPGVCLMPAGCSSPEDALRRLLNNLTATDRKRLDHQVQGLLQEKLGGLAEVCLKSSNLVLDLELLLQRAAEECVTTRLVGTNVVELFLNQHPNETSAIFDIRQALVGAAPELARPLGDSQDEVRVLALPPGPRAAQFRSLMHKGMPESIAVTESPDDIVFYREQPVLPLAALNIFGRDGQEAYQQLLHNENVYPHARTDITDWTKLETEE